MENNMEKEKTKKGVLEDKASFDNKAKAIDLIKFFACLLIVVSHCLPISSNETVNYYYGQWFFRFCVPFFFVSSGYFFLKMDRTKRMSYIKRIGLLYGISTIIYLPLIIKNSNTVRGFIFDLVFGYHHLWYLSALLIGLLLFHLLDYIWKNNYLLIPLLLACGILFDEYFKFFNSTELTAIAKAIGFIGGPRHALFFALPMLLIGGLLNRIQRSNNLLLIGLFILLLLVSFFEACFLKKHLGSDITNDVTLFGWTPSIPLFLLACQLYVPIKKTSSRTVRKVSDVIYVIHVYVIVLIDYCLNADNLLRLFLILLLSIALAVMIYCLLFTLKKRLNISMSKNHGH